MTVLGLHFMPIDWQRVHLRDRLSVTFIHYDRRDILLDASTPAEVRCDHHLRRCRGRDLDHGLILEWWVDWCEHGEQPVLILGPIEEHSWPWPEMTS